MPFTYIFRLPVVLRTVSLIVFLSLFTLVQAETKTIMSEAIYSMGDGETPNFAEAMVLQKAKQRALEEAGTYVESYTHVRNLDLTVDEIKTIAGGMMQTEIIEQSRAQEGNGFRFYVKIRALVTTDKIEDLARRIKGGNVPEQNKKVREAFAKIESDLALLKRQITKSKTETERELILDKIRVVETEFRQVRLTEMTLYQRLLSGSELSAQVSKALFTQQKQKEEEQKRSEWQAHALKVLLETLRNNGFTLLIDPPETDVHLSEPESTTLAFPVTINLSDQLKRAIKDLEKAYSEDIPRKAEIEVDKALSNLALSLSVFLKNGSEYTGGPYTLTFKSLQSYDLKYIFQQQRIVGRVGIPSPFVEQVTYVEGRVSIAKPLEQPKPVPCMHTTPASVPPSVAPIKQSNDAMRDIIKDIELPPDAPKRGDIRLDDNPRSYRPCCLQGDLQRELDEELRKLTSKTVPSAGAYLALVRQRIKNSWNAPPLDLTGQAYVVVVQFRLHKNGSVTGVTIEQSSGNDYYDLAGKRAVLSANPLPAFPPDITDSYFDAYFTFNVSSNETIASLSMRP